MSFSYRRFQSFVHRLYRCEMNDFIDRSTDPRGGMHAMPTALAAAAQRHGVTSRYGTEVTR